MDKLKTDPGESYHQLKRSVAFANSGKLRFENECEQNIWNEDSRLLTDYILYYNLTTLLDKATCFVRTVQTFMNIISVIIFCLSLQITADNDNPILVPDKFIQRHQTSAPQSETENLNLTDKARNREIPVKLYSPVPLTKTSEAKKSRLKLAIISHGYGGENTAYSFIANNLVAHGYLVASVQHELPADEPLPTTGNIFEARKPSWERGVQNILFVISELKKIKPDLDFKNLLLVGHSHGGDTSMLFAQVNPKLVRKIISLDNRRMPLPRTKKIQILAIRSSDQIADAGVLPTQAEQKKFPIRIIQLRETIHNDMWDGASAKQKLEMNQIISSFLRN